MKTRHLIILLLLSVQANAQQTAVEQRTDVVAQQIKRFYNERQIDSIYAMTDSNFRKMIKPQVMKNAFEQQLLPYGKITKLTFERSKEDVNIYRADIGSGVVLNMLVGLNKANGKVSTFSMQPYKAAVKEADKRKDIYHDNALLSNIDSMAHQYAMAYMETSKSPGLSIGILMGTHSYFYNYGDAVKGEEIHPTRNTLYEIGSITKTFTAYLLADAVVRNRIALDDPITKYLPDSVAANKDLQQIRIVQLSNHSSGLPRLPDNYLEGSTNFVDPYASYDDKVLFKYLKGFKATRAPGAKVEYSNLGFGLLGVILERVNGMPLEEQYHQLIFQPMKMKNTYSGPIKDSSMVARGYDEDGKLTNYWNFKSMAGAGAIKSSTEELIRYALPFALMPRNKGKYDERTLLLQQITFKEEPFIVSLGWRLDTDDKESFTMTHNGGTGGFRSYIGICPSKRLAVVVLNNCAEEPGAPKIGDPLIKSLKGLEQ